jgi:hypothetical protein
MPVNPKIVTCVKRLNNGWPQFPMTDEQRMEFENRLDGLDPHILNKAVTNLIETESRRSDVSVNRIKLEYDKLRPAQGPTKDAVRDAHPYDMARQIADNNRSNVIAGSKALFDQIKTAAGKAALRQYLSAAAWVMAQGVVASRTRQPFQMTSDRIATGYMAWTPPGEDLREARRLFNRGRELGRIEIEVPGRAMDWFKRQTDTGFGAKLDVKKMPKDEFEKGQQFHVGGAVA